MSNRNPRERISQKIKNKGLKDKEKKGTITGPLAVGKIGLNAIFGESKSEAPKPGEDPALDMRRRVSLPKKEKPKSKLKKGMEKEEAKNLAKKKEKKRGSKQS